MDFNVIFSGKRLFIVLLVILTVSCSSEQKPLTIHPLFTDHMVLQQNTATVVWGVASSNSSVSFSSDWTEDLSTTTDEQGNWSLQIKTPEAGGPYAFTITSGTDKIMIKDVLVGEVWLASGQSNMEMPLMGWPPNDTILNSENEIENSENFNIRMFTVERNLSLDELNWVKGEWLVSSPEVAENFSATAYFFAKRLQKELNIPIGIIHSSWGGTPAEAWTSKANLEKLGDFNAELESIKDPSMEELKNNWYSRWQSKDIPSKENDWSELKLNDTLLSTLEYDDSDWEKIELPGDIDIRDNWQMNGVIWLRQTFLLEQEPNSDYELFLGAVDDMDYTFVNGKLIGETLGGGKHTQKRIYTIPKTLLQKGENSIAIRVIDTGGGGGLSDSITLSSEDESLNLSGSWNLLATAEIHEGKFYQYNIEEAATLRRPNIIDINSHTPSVLYNAMIAPIIPYAIKGAIWYQGESNVGRAEQYEKLFPLMIEDWRSQWQTNFPFYFVQIAPFNYGNNLSPALRDAQRKTLSLEKTGMVVTLDIGNPVNIHPANKTDVGNRLAGLALKNDYSMDVTASGPLYTEHSINDHKITVVFSNTGSGLMPIETSISGFEIAGDDKIFREAKAVVINDQIELTSAEISNPIYVRYAWKDTSEASLFNKEGLPASSFCSPMY